MQLKRVRKSVSGDTIIRTLFGPISEHNERPYTKIQPDWCTLSEARLFEKLITVKPFGINRHFGISALTNYMNHIYENEETDFVEYLSKEDFERYNERKSAPPDGTIIAFEPIYRIRPIPDQIRQKLSELYDVKVVEEHECIIDAMAKQMEFFLPDGDFSEVVHKKEEALAASSAPPAKKRRRTTVVAGTATPDSSSRCSTPAQK